MCNLYSSDSILMIDVMSLKETINLFFNKAILNKTLEYCELYFSYSIFIFLVNMFTSVKRKNNISLEKMVSAKRFTT